MYYDKTPKGTFLGRITRFDVWSCLARSVGGSRPPETAKKEKFTIGDKVT